MQHANKTVSQGNRSNTGHEEKHWWAVMHTSDTAPWRAHFSGEEPPTEDLGKFHHTKEEVSPSCSFYWGKKAELAEIRHQIENLDHKWSWASRILGCPTGISSYKYPWSFERMTSSLRTNKEVIMEICIRCYLEYGACLVPCSSKEGGRKK